MELRHLRYFIKAAELLNFTKAAESLYVAQPTLSVQIHQLEEQLGAELFVKVGRMVRLTQAGEAFLVRAQRVVTELEQAIEEVSAIKGGLRGNLSITALSLIVCRLLTKWVPTFKTQFPEVGIYLRSGNIDEIEAEIASGVMDIGFSMPPTDENLQWTELFEDKAFLFVAESHPIATKKSVSVADLRDLPLGLPSDRLAPVRTLAKYFDEIAIKPRIELTCDEGQALIELVRSSNLATILPDWAAYGEPGICALPLPSPGISIKIGAMFVRLTPAAAAFCELVKRDLGDTVRALKSS